MTDVSGATGTATRAVSAGVPAVTIATPSAATTWSVGQELFFSGSAVDSAGAAIPDDKLTWTIVLEHGLCPACHEHAISTKVGPGGKFDTPDHAYPSSILLRLTATDAVGLVGTATRRLQPKTTQLTIASSPAGLDLNLDGETAAGPFTRTAIVGSNHSLDADAIEDGYSFTAWSDGGARAHSFAAPATPTTYTATYINKLPTASFSVSDTTPVRGQSVTFDASGSSDPEGTTLTYAWDLDNDGDYDDGTNVKASRSFAATGTATVRLQVKDAHNGTHTAQHTLTVQNEPPTASITPGDRSPLIQSPVTFTAVAGDPDGTVAKREWDLDGDGGYADDAHDRHDRHRDLRDDGPEDRGAPGDGRRRRDRRGDDDGHRARPARARARAEGEDHGRADAQGRDDPPLLGEGAARRDGARHLQGDALPGGQAGQGRRDHEAPAPLRAELPRRNQARGPDHEARARRHARKAAHPLAAPRPGAVGLVPVAGRVEAARLPGGLTRLSARGPRRRSRARRWRRPS